MLLPCFYYTLTCRVKRESAIGEYDVLITLSKWCAVQKSQQTLKNGANGFDGYFLAFLQQIAHRAKYGEAEDKSFACTKNANSGDSLKSAAIVLLKLHNGRLCRLMSFAGCPPKDGSLLPVFQ